MGPQLHILRQLSFSPANKILFVFDLRFETAL
jgi:hypothetical protein